MHYVYTDAFIAFLPPVPSPAVVEEMVGDNAVLSCDDNNPSPLMISFEWRNSDGVVVNNFRIYQIEGVTEAHADVYTCIFTSGYVGESLSATVRLIVLCKQC